MRGTGRDGVVLGLPRPLEPEVVLGSGTYGVVYKADVDSDGAAAAPRDAVVYQARGEKLVRAHRCSFPRGARLALKRQRASGEEQRAELHREGELAAWAGANGLGPAVFCVVEGRRNEVTMELADASLDAWLRERRADPACRRDAWRQAYALLAKLADLRPMVCGDLKPGNLLVLQGRAAAASCGKVLLSDWDTTFWKPCRRFSSSVAFNVFALTVTSAGLEVLQPEDAPGDVLLFLRFLLGHREAFAREVLREQPEAAGVVRYYLRRALRAGRDERGAPPLRSDVERARFMADVATLFHRRAWSETLSRRGGSDVVVGPLTWALRLACGRAVADGG